MTIMHTEDFKLAAVRIALSSGLSCAQITSDLGGISPLAFEAKVA